jgi:uncharacterized membrane protein
MIERGSPTPTWRRLALPASVVLNLFFVAAIGGHLLHRRHEDVAYGSVFGRALANAEAKLPPPDAAAFGAVMRRDAPHFADAARALGEARQELGRQISAEQFDPAGVKQALAAWRTAWSRFTEDFGDTLVAALAQVSPDGRRKLVADHHAASRGVSTP